MKLGLHIVKKRRKDWLWEFLCYVCVFYLWLFFVYKMLSNTCFTWFTVVFRLLIFLLMCRPQCNLFLTYIILRVNFVLLNNGWCVPLQWCKYIPINRTADAFVFVHSLWKTFVLFVVTSICPTVRHVRWCGKRWRATVCCEKSKFAISSRWLKNGSACHPVDIMTLS